MSDQSTGGQQNGWFSGILKRMKSGFPDNLHIDGRNLSITYMVIFVVVSIFLFPPTRKNKEIQYREGDIASTDVIAPFIFSVPVSQQEKEINRAKARVGVPPVYRKKDDVIRHLPDDLKGFMARIAEITAVDSLSDEEKISLIRETAPALGKDDIGLLLSKDRRDRILREGLKLQQSFFSKGIINDDTPLRRRDYVHVTVISDAGESLVPSSPLIRQSDLERIILDSASKVFSKDDKTIKIFYSILRSHLMPNLVFDLDETLKRRNDKVEKVPEAFTVSENQRIIAKHDKVTGKQVEILKALESNRTRVELQTSLWKRMGAYTGKIIRILILTLILWVALMKFDRKVVTEPAKLTLAFITLLFFLLLTALVMRLSFLDPYLIPVAFVPLVITAFFGVMTAMIFSIFASLVLITHIGLPAGLVFISIIAGGAAIISISQLRERKNFYSIFLYVAMAYIVGITSFGLTEGIGLRGFLLGALWGITNAFTCTVLVMFLLPIFESLFNVMTNFSLMELSDLNRPLLKKLIIEAPGTYHHSMLVGNMVEAAAEEVGANGLLARVSAYYHDIGKLAKPEYFFENKGDNLNKHEKLSPTMSALILASHVKEGVELAKREKLPGVVIDAINEHHGTTVMAFFYNKALEFDSHDSVNIDDFRYPGPRPHSKETALIMLADSSEAAARSLKEPTASRIRTIVSRIFETRMNDGELDYSGLTLNDIAVIKEKYVQFLTRFFHPRISYPNQEDDQQESEKENEGNNKQPSQSNGKKRV
ncbi:MAG: HDIG domain-containing protein [Candidatus Krumholzibacteriota bacterium]|nr:HDIG domain-containing protein [Candidatus Krumholzibacteriota bacterium]